MPHDVVLKAVAHHTDQRWILLYVQRWLEAPLQQADGTLVARDRTLPRVLRRNVDRTTARHAAVLIELDVE